MGIDIPPGGGAISGIGETFQPDLHTGTGNVSLALPLPPGRGTLAPGLTLAYSSGNGNSPFGLGWTISIPRIARRTDKAIPTYEDSADVFVLSGAEELAPVPTITAKPPDTPADATTTCYRPRTESAWARITHVTSADNDYWDVWSRDGLHSRYGTQRPPDADDAWADEAAITRPDGRIFAWLLSRTSDTLGNHIAYTYASDGTSPQRYLDSVRYADYGDPTDPSYAVTVKFRYTDRPDAFRESRAGFELSTTLRATTIEIATAGSAETPATRVDLSYRDSTAALSLLASVTVTGQDPATGGTQPLPPLTFTYRDWTPQSRRYRTMRAPLPPRPLGQGLELVDLFGEGLPSPVELGATPRYWRNRGDGSFDPPRALTQAPAGATFGTATTLLDDLDGDGRPEVAVTAGGRTTVWTLSPHIGADRNDGHAGFVPAPPVTGGVPSVGYTDPQVRVLDVDGDRIPDLLLGGQPPAVAYGDGSGGFDRLRPLADAPPPLTSLADPHVQTADMTGDGLSDVVEIYNGSVRYWPSMGRGRYGEPVRMLGAPRFDDAAADLSAGYDPRRLLLGDVDGTGTADVVYVGPGYTTVWLNQSGNSFSEPTVIRGTPSVDAQTAVRLADLNGIGVSGILWSGLGPDGHWAFLDLTGGAKPYLLTGMDNNHGAQTTLTWSTSTAYATADRLAGQPWRTTLPFPVHVVAATTTIDAHAHTTLTSAFTYHEGYWDPADREFRGFGRVEHSDTLTSSIATIPSPGIARELDPLTARTPVPADLDPAARGNLLTNWSFDTTGGPQTTLITTAEKTFAGGPSAAPGWGVWNNAATTTTTDLADSDLPQGYGGRMLHVTTGAGGCGIVQTFAARDAGPEHAVSSVWVKVVSGEVGMGTGNGGDTGIDVSVGATNQWTLLQAGNHIATPANELIVYATSSNGAEFYVDHAWVHADDLPADPFASPPVRTVTWFHLGPVGPAHGNWSEIAYADGYWPGDPPVLPYLDASPLPATLDRPALREALRGLRGRTLRTELYADDGDPTYGQRPYEIHEAVFQVVPVTDGRTPEDRSWLANPVVGVQEVFSRSTTWDRGTDPMTRLHLTSYDGYSRPTAVVDLGVPRGRHLGDVGAPCLAIVAYTDYATRNDNTAYFLHRTSGTRHHEAVDDGTGTVLDFASAALNGQCDGDLRSLELNYYDGEPFTGLAHGELGDHALPVRTETLLLTPDHLREIIAPVVEAGSASSLPPYLTVDGSTAPDAAWAGYPQEFRDGITRPADGAHLGYLWQPADSVHVAGYYAETSRVCYDIQTGQGRGLVTESLDPCGGKTTTTWDGLDLFPATVLDPVGLSTQATYDYRVLKPAVVTDPNDNRTAIGYNALGMPAWIAKLGKPDGREGDTPAQPGQFFDYDLTAPGPISVTSTRRIDYRWTLVDQKNAQLASAGQPPLTDAQIDAMFPPEEASIYPERFIKTVEYSDGHGRLLQKRVQADDVVVTDVGLPVDGSVASNTVEADLANARVIVSSWKLYDNKGREVVAYEPFYATGYDYAEPTTELLTLASTTQRFDPRGRVTVAIAPDGGQHRSVYGVPVTLTAPDIFVPTPWETYAYDPIDNAGRTHPTDHLPQATTWDTPSSTVVDALGRTVTTLQRGLAQDAVTQQTYDIDGHLLTVTDPLERLVAAHVYDSAGIAWSIWLLDAGTVRTFHDAAGGVVEQRDDKGAVTLTGYDDAHRAIRGWAADRPMTNPTLRLVTVYAEDKASGLTTADAITANTLGRVVTVYDEAGAVSTARYDLASNPVSTSRAVLRPEVLLSDLPVDPSAPTASWTNTSYVIDWQPAPGSSFAQRAAQLVSTPYQSDATFDALGRRISLTAPIDSTGSRSIVTHTYGRGGGITAVAVDGQSYVDQVAYDAHGRRTLAWLGNGVLLRYTYDPLTMRMRRCHARHASYANHTWTCDEDVLQDLTHRYDVAGNLLGVRDQTPGSGLPVGVDPVHSVGPDTLDRAFSYDALNRLITATGRETDIVPDLPWTDQPRSTDVTKARPYTESYTYDLVGNLLTLQHQTNGAATGAYTRTFALAARSNRLSTLTLGPRSLPYSFDPTGNQLTEADNRFFEWDHSNRLATFRNQAGAATPSVYAQYRYNTAGERVTKLVKRANTYEVTLYLGGFVRVLRAAAGGAWISYDTLEVVDGANHVATLLRGNPLPDDPLGEHVARYHLADHLGSTTVTLAADSTPLNREEYLPYGESSFGSVALKRYRFTGQERDNESGLNYHSARYYSPWVARWTSADPAGLTDGLTLYGYARQRPTCLVDRAGRASVEHKINGNVRYNEVVPKLRSLGHNVQRDHVIAQGKQRLVNPNINTRNQLTVLQETGKARGGAPPKPHTQATFHDPESDVAEIKRLKTLTPKDWESRSFNDEITLPSINSRRRSGYDPNATHKAVLDELGSMFETHQPNRAPGSKMPELDWSVRTKESAPSPSLASGESGLAGDTLRAVGVVGDIALVGQVFADLHAGHTGKAAVEGAIGLGVGAVLKRVPVLAPVAVAGGAIMTYYQDTSIEARSFAVGEAVAGPNHPVIGGLVSAGTAVGLSLYQSTVGPIKEGLVGGVNALLETLRP